MTSEANILTTVCQNSEFWYSFVVEKVCCRESLFENSPTLNLSTSYKYKGQSFGPKFYRMKFENNV